MTTARVPGYWPGQQDLPNRTPFDRHFLEQAACAHPLVDMEWFFSQDRGMEQLALGICARCPVMDACKTAARENREKYGTWGGETQHDRRNAIRTPRPKVHGHADTGSAKTAPRAGADTDREAGRETARAS